MTLARKQYTSAVQALEAGSLENSDAPGELLWGLLQEVMEAQMSECSGAAKCGPIARRRARNTIDPVLRRDLTVCPLLRQGETAMLGEDVCLLS